jgi:hypothetical protein
MGAVTASRTARGGGGLERGPAPGWGPPHAAAAVHATGAGVTAPSRICAEFVSIDERRIAGAAGAG